MTQAEWAAVMGSNPSWFDGKKDDEAKGLDTSRFPVESVSWDVICGKDGKGGPDTFLGKVNARQGVKAVFGKAGKFDLPHEDEWEYAARGGHKDRRPFYWGMELIGSQANMHGNEPYGTPTKRPFFNRTTAVGSYATKYPHPYGLCDMHGNVWEWCKNPYDQTNNFCVLRGGSWTDSGLKCRAAYRGKNSRDFLRSNLGCRLCIRLD